MKVRGVFPVGIMLILLLGVSSSFAQQEEEIVKAYTINFTKQDNVKITNIKESPKNSGKFSYSWRHVCGVCGWVDNSRNSGTASGGNGGFQQAFSCFD